MITADQERKIADAQRLWARLAAPLPAGVISWRQDGRPVERRGKYYARFVAFIDAQTVRARLDMVCPGEWDLTLETLPQTPDSDGVLEVSFKARLQILGVIREDVGTGENYKNAATDAFKRAAVRFGIGHELYSYEQNWVEVDGDGKYAKPLEDPAVAYARRYGQRNGAELTPDEVADARRAAFRADGQAPSGAQRDGAGAARVARRDLPTRGGSSTAPSSAR